MFSLFFASKYDPALMQNGPYRPFSLLHIALTLVSFALIYVLVKYLKRKTLRIRLKWAWCAYALLVSLNIIRLAWDLGTGQFDFREDIPLQLCGIQMFTLPFAIASRGKAGDHMREFAFSYGTVGFVLGLLLPLTTLYDYPVLHFRNMQSMLYHACLGFIAIMLTHLGYKPETKNTYKADGVLFGCVLVTGIVNIITGSNYLYTSALPITFDTLRWPFYLPFFAAFIFTAGRVPYWAYNYFQSKRCSQEMRENIRVSK